MHVLSESRRKTQSSRQKATSEDWWFVLIQRAVHEIPEKSQEHKVPERLTREEKPKIFSADHGLSFRRAQKRKVQQKQLIFELASKGLVYLPKEKNNGIFEQNSFCIHLVNKSRTFCLVIKLTNYSGLRKLNLNLLIIS